MAILARPHFRAGGVSEYGQVSAGGKLLRRKHDLEGFWLIEESSLVTISATADNVRINFSCFSGGIKSSPDESDRINGPKVAEKGMPCPALMAVSDRIR